MADFYVDRLGLPATERTEQRLALQIGHSLLIFEQDNEPYEQAPYYHFAFNIPKGSIDEAACWLGERARLLPVDGQHIAEFPNWAARSIYAYDPGGNIIECIARQELPLPPAGIPFSDADLHGISEIGLVVADVAGFSADLQQRFGLPFFHRQKPDPRFSVLGDDEGLFIIVPPQRVWYPTADNRSQTFPLEITFEVHPQGGAQQLYLQ